MHLWFDTFQPSHRVIPLVWLLLKLLPRHLGLICNSAGNEESATWTVLGVMIVDYLKMVLSFNKTDRCNVELGDCILKV